MHSRARRLLLAIGLFVGVTIVPLGQVAACDCAMTDLPQAILEADVAIIGTPIGSAEAEAVADLGEKPTAYVWTVERSRDPMSATTLTVAAWPDNGANCGITFAADDRWLLLAHHADGGLETNSCMRNTRLADAAPEDIEIIESMVALPVASGEGLESWVSLPTPILVALGALAVLVVVSVAAFRRSGPDGLA